MLKIGKANTLYLSHRICIYIYQPLPQWEGFNFIHPWYILWAHQAAVLRKFKQWQWFETLLSYSDSSDNYSSDFQINEREHSDSESTDTSNCDSDGDTSDSESSDGDI